MKRKLLSAFLLLALATFLCSGCATPMQGAVSGGIAGAIAGTLIGAALGSPELGALIGGGIGMMAGAAAGGENQQRFIEAHRAKWNLLPDSWKNTPGQLAMIQSRLCYVTADDYIVWHEDKQTWKTDD
ncbi:MAG: hypothetical protein V1814_00255 [Candidatus Moraniibacteriota bacterium]